MSKAIANNDLIRFLNNLSAAKSRLLLLDYDGTIAPFSSDRHRAVPYRGIPELLHRIITSCGTRLIVVSGRAAHEVPPLLGLHPTPEIWGADGAQRIHADGRCEELRVTHEVAQVLAQAEVRLDGEGLGERMEVKLAAVAVHWRGLSASEILKTRTTAYQILQSLSFLPELVLAEFEEGIELRLASANKGEALRTLLSELDPQIPVAYLGDDTTDEDAFRILNGRGLTVLVGPKHRFTAAQMWLRPPDELIGFLMDWIRACGGGQ